jgi:hypothetical protein
MKMLPNKTTSESTPSKCYFKPSNDLFPELLPPVLPARLPKKGTRNGEALEAFLSGPQNQAEYESSWRLGAIVKSLQYDGWAFIKRDINKPGCRRPITEYALDRSDPSTTAALALRQKGSIDLTLAGLLAFAGVCALILIGMPS